MLVLGYAPAVKVAGNHVNEIHDLQAAKLL